MLDKVKEILNSVRFWQVTFGALFLILGHYLPSFEFLWNTLAGWLGVVAGIGTLDKGAKSLSGKE